MSGKNFSGGGEESAFDEPLEPVVVMYIERLKGLYLLMRRRYDPSISCVASRDYPLLTRLGKKLYHEGIDPAEYIRFCFMDYYVGKAGAVYMGMLVSPQAIAAFKSTEAERAGEFRDAIDIQCRYFEGWLSSGKDVKKILTDPAYSLGPVMRYVLAKTYGLLEILPLFEEGARMAVAFAPRYFDFFGELLPGDWKHGPSVQGSGASGNGGDDGPSGQGQGGDDQRTNVHSKYGFWAK